MWYRAPYGVTRAIVLGRMRDTAPIINLRVSLRVVFPATLLLYSAIDGASRNLGLGNNSKSLEARFFSG